MLHSYTCDRVATTYGGTYCQYLPGEPVDAFVSRWVLTALEPAALTLSLEATAHLEQERQALDQLWQQRLERAAYEAERAARHYRAIEPEHRLVARQLAKEENDELGEELEARKAELKGELEGTGRRKPTPAPKTRAIKAKKANGTARRSATRESRADDRSSPART